MLIGKGEKVGGNRYEMRPADIEKSMEENKIGIDFPLSGTVPVIVIERQTVTASGQSITITSKRMKNTRY